jgi:hypothetical protein
MAGATMDLRDTPDEARFRGDVRSFIEQELLLLRLRSGQGSGQAPLRWRGGLRRRSRHDE